MLNIAANPLSANKDAHELLKTASGVWATDETLSIYGQGGATVYIYDRKVNMSGCRLMTYLKYIQSSSIATIEIIPKAGAEYSADSEGGVFYDPTDRDKIGVQFDYHPDRTFQTSNFSTETRGPEFNGTTFGSYESKDLFHNVNVALNLSHTTDSNGSVLKLISNYN